MYTAQQIRDYITQNGLTGNPVEIRKAQQKYGVSDAALNEAIGWERQSTQDPQTGLWNETFTVPSKWEGMPAPTPVAAPNYMQPGAPAGAPAGAAPNPYLGAPANPYMGGQRPQQQPQQQPMQQPMQRPGLDNPYTAWMADSVGQRLGQNLQRNILPGIRSAASAAGGLGGSRQGIAEGMAIGDTMTGYGNTLANLYSGQFNQDRNYGLANDALDLSVYNTNQNWMRQGQQDQLNFADRMLGWNQQYGVGNATQIQNTPLNYWQQFGNQASQMAGLGGTNTQQMQGNPYLGALGGAMTGAQLWKTFGG